MINSFSLFVTLFALLISQHSVAASIVYGRDGSISHGVLARSTFSDDSASPAPRTPSFVNFKENDIDYLAHIGSKVPYSVQISTNQTTTASLKPWTLVTVISAPSDCSSDYDSFIQSFTSSDDVWSPSFLDTVFLASGNCGVKWTSAIKDCVSAKGPNFATIETTLADKSASGPYLMLSDDTSMLYPVYRLYTDPQYAFTEGTLPVDLPANASQQSFVQSPTGGQDSFAASAVGIPVPSRLYFSGKQSAAKPLAGVRMAIKDIFDIKGLRTGCGNRAYYTHYNAAMENSFPIQRFLEKGAILVGKTKASQFANGETSTADWVDQLCPFNVRGDGYQDPSSSSSGSGASQGAYDWIDVTVGSDTGGSIRGPAGVNGVLGIRPSTGIISLTGVMPLSDVQDTAGYFARDAETFAKVGNAFYGEIVTAKNTNEYAGNVDTLLVPSDFWEGYLLPSNDSSVKANTTFGSATTDFAKFIEALSSIVGNATIEQDPFAGLWNASQAGTTNGDIDTYLNTTYPVLIGGYQYRVLAQPFIASYSEANGGREPFIDPVPLVRWAFAESVGQDGYQDALDEKDTFTTFVRDQVLPSNCSTLLLYPQTDGTPYYRNTYLSSPEAPTGFGAGRIANLAGVPEIVIPISQAVYNSTITKSTSNSLPVSMSIVGGRNCDGQLLRIASKLEKAGITSAVKVGAYTF